MIPGVIIRTKHERACAMLTEVEPGAFVVETMRFLYPSEAKKELEAQVPKSMSHRRGEKDALR